MARKLFLAIGIILILSACGLFSKEDDSKPSNGNTTTEWVRITDGAEYRTFSITPSDATPFDMHIVRLDPKQVRFRVHYQPAQAYTYNSWQEQLAPEAIAFINANFFSEDNVAIGLVIADGTLYGTTLVGYGGMFAINADGSPTLLSLARTPYRGTGYTQAIQSFPMLIEPDGTPSTIGQGFDELARRTAIAQDDKGYIYLMSTGTLGQISLRELQNWLLNSELNIKVAFALDGGRSSLMYVRTEPPIQIPSLVRVPIILAVYER